MFVERSETKMSLMRYDAGYLPPKVFGLHNAGASCFFNATMQSLLSCPAFIQTLIESRNDAFYQINPISRILLQFFESKASRTDLISPLLYTEFIKFLTSGPNKDHAKFGFGQQCAGECITLLLEMMENLLDVQKLFIHRYQNSLFCPVCSEYTSTNENEYHMFSIQPDLTTEQLERFQHLDKKYEKLNDKPVSKSVSVNDFLFSQNGYVDENHQCAKCHTRCAKYQKIELKMIPEILIVLAKKYDQDGQRKLNIATNFPEEMVFSSANGEKNFKYIAVAQIEHSGNLHGGHYWAVCRRCDENGAPNSWFNFNDIGVAPAKFQPTENTYIVFYHFVGFV